MEERSLEDIHKILLHAKIDTADLHPAVQCLCFSSVLGVDDITLLEIDNNVLGNLLAGESLTIRGLKSDAAYLCTQKETYEMKEAETSNTLLMLSNCITDDELLSSSESVTGQQVEAVKHCYFELKPVKPRLKRLREHLEENPYDGTVNEMDRDEKKRRYTFEDLLDEVQASEEELKQGLREIKACLIDGYWRLLDFDYLAVLFGSITEAIEEYSWSFYQIPYDDLCEQLQDRYPLVVIKHIMEIFATAKTSTDGAVYYEIKNDEVCRHQAQLILSHTRNAFHLHEFEMTWQLAVPEGMQTDMNQLRGMVLIDRESRPESITYFPVAELPENIEERFEVLFKTKPRWIYEEIAPFIEGLCSDKQGVGVLLTKYCRVSSQNEVKLYSSKKM